ncbi:tetratricopeptide repeat protein [Desulfatibacillum aliphaticivorans]|uniref:tetratricopeptide repeat protein n=1 Tax=Desulfatibacillum aliphaticivorans TaxID=218208 RepID=UPI00041F74D5|nr:tetratricopeptide repeat protein [Desulfatibacillum aliphaticivorans]
MTQPKAFLDSPWKNDAALNTGRLLYPLALCALAAAMYWQCIFFDFANYDDLALTANNPLIKDLSLESLKRIFTFFSLESYYPIRLLSIAVDRAVWGANPMGYHLTNVLVHMANILMAFGLARIIAEQRGWDGRASRFLGVFTAMLFGLHAAAADTVAWIPGREELLMFFFCLLCLRLHIHADHSQRPFLIRVLTAYACAFSCLSNVVGAVTPALVALYILTLDRSGGWKKVLKTTWFLWIIGGGAIFIKALSLLAWDESSRTMLLPHLPSALRYFHEILAAPQITYKDPVSLAEKIRAVLSVYGGNLGHVFLPLKMPCLYPDDIPKSFFSRHVLGGLAAVTATGAAMFLLRKNRMFMFGAGWFLIALLPSSQILQHHIPRADRFLYLPLFGFALALSYLAMAWDNKRDVKLARMALMVFVLFLAVRGGLHLPVWEDGMALYQHAVKSYPNNFQAHFFYAQELKRKGFYEEALLHHAIAINLRPGEKYIWHPYYEVLIDMGRLDEAEAIAQKAVKDFPQDAQAHNNLAIILSARDKADQSLAEFEKAVALDPHSTIMRENAADEYARRNQPEKAVHHLREALRISPRTAILHLRLAIELEKLGDVSRAIHHYKEAKRYNPTFVGVDFQIKRLLDKTSRSN